MWTDPLTWRYVPGLLLRLPIGIAWFVSLVTLISMSFGLVIIWVGVPLMGLTMVGWRGAAILERRYSRTFFGEVIEPPYRPLPEGNLLHKWRVLGTDPATWKDLAFLFVAFPLGILEFTLTVVIISTLPLSLVSFPYLLRFQTFVHMWTARQLLGPSERQRLTARAEALEQRTEQLEASRARGVDATEAERRRIERDLHDGAQQRLLAVAMDLGRARAKLEYDPAGARDLLESAHAGAKEAIVELRNLARGIYPAILTDRGLDAAISAVAARSEMAVDVEVDLPTRPPAAVESIAYFIVSEGLTNVTKYARATRATIRIARDDNWIVVEIADNGVGGAVAAKGGGLAGLADRAATIDGLLTINSPLGGPTVVRADLPCVW
jgi:signal transduction histidine kinase